MKDGVKANPTKKCLTLEVSGEEFKISFVSNWVINQYNKMVITINRVNQLRDETQAILNDLKAGRITNEEAEPKLKKLENEGKEIMESSFFDQRLEIIKEVLESNGHKFNRDWWEKKTEPIDINNFLYYVIHKDFDKKKAEEVVKVN